MGVVNVDDDALGEVGPIRAVVPLVGSDNTLHSGRNEEILLLQAESLAFGMVVLGIEYLGNYLRKLFLFHGGKVLALSEQIHIQRFCGTSCPQPQRINCLTAIASDGYVVRYSLDRLITLMFVHQAPVFQAGLYPAAKAHRFRLFGDADFPAVTTLKPRIRNFHLISIHDPLAKQAVLIANTAAVSVKTKRGEAVQQTGRQTSQSAVTQAGIRF